MSYIEELRRQKQLEHYQEDDPWGKEQADAIAQFGTNVMEGVVGGVTDWWKRSSADQEGWFDDALRLTAGGVKNVAAAAEDQEGWTDDALRLAGGGIKNVATVGLNVLGAPGYVGGKIGGAAIEALGGDRRLGEWGGGFAGDIILGGYAAKGLKVARAGTQYARLSPFQRALQYGSTSGAMESAAKHTGEGLKAFKKGAKIAAQKEFAGEIALAGKIKDADTLMQVEGLKQAAQPGFYSGLPIPALRKGQGAPRYITPVAKLVDDKTARTGNLKILNKPYTKAQTAAFNKRKALQSTGPFAHHHMLDVEFSGAALNRADFDKVIKELNKYGIKPGDAEANIIGLFHDKPAGFRSEMREQIVNLAKKSGIDISGPKGSKNWAIQDDYLRAWKTRSIQIEGVRIPGELAPLFPPKPKTSRGVWGYGPELPGQTAYQRRFKTLGINRKDIKMSPGSHILGKDHIDIVHDLQNTLPDRLSILADIESGEWFLIPPKEAAARIASVYEQQRRIAINTAKWRLGLIKDHIGLGKGKKFKPAELRRSPAAIRQWVMENPAEAAALGWKTSPNKKDLLKPVGKISKELKEVFALVDDTPKPKALEALQIHFNRGKR